MSEASSRNMPLGRANPWQSTMRAGKTARGTALLALATAATAGVLRLTFWLEAPAPAAPVDGWRNLAVPKYRLLPTQAGQPLQGRNLSHGGKASFRVIGGDGKDLGITLSLLASRLRGTDDVSIGAITRHMPDLLLKDGVEQTVTLPGAESGKVLVGSIDHRPALQTCITAGGQAGVGTSDLLRDAQTARRDSVVDTRLRQLAGLQVPLRAECALVTVEGSGADASEERLKAFLMSLLSTWKQSPPWPALPGQLSSPAPDTRSTPP